MTMRRFSTFLCGMIAGGLLIYAALSHHIVQNRDGLHLVPKLDSTLAATYVDVQESEDRCNCLSNTPRSRRPFWLPVARI